MLKNNKLKAEGITKDAFRFLIGGGLNTAITYLAYLFFLLFTSYSIAYALSWALGLLIIVTLYPSKVFVGSHNSRKKNVALVGQYALIFFCGLQCLNFLVMHFGVQERWAALFTMAITTILNFLFMRLLYRCTFFQ